MANREFSVKNSQFKVVGLDNDDPYLNGIKGRCEGNFQDFCCKFIDDDFIAMDIGANIGITSIIMSQYLQKGKIFSFEPGKNIFQLLQENLKINSINNVSAYNYAVSNESRPVRFIENSAYGHIDANSLDIHNSSNIDNLVDTYTLDDIVDKLKLDKLDFIKVDIEGFEPQFFDGAKTTLAHFNPIVYFELNSWCLLDHANNNPLDFMKRITSEFLFVYRVNKDAGESVILEKIESNPTDAARFLVHSNITQHGSVDDIVVSNDPTRMHYDIVALTNNRTVLVDKT